MLRQVPIELLVTTILGIGKSVDCLMAHADRMALQAHPACNLFRRPAGFEPIFDGFLQIRVHDHLPMDGAAVIIHVLSRYRVIPIQLRHFRVREKIALQLAIDRRRRATQPIRDLWHRHFGFTPLGNLPAFFQTQVGVTASHSASSMQTSVLIQNSHFVCESTMIKAENLIMRVLLVEDDPTTSKSIELMLTHANLNVYATDLGEEGIDLAKLYDYDLILLDLNLPDMNGHEVLRQLRMARIETPILILSGADDTENKIKGFGFGADDYLTKPFHREELVARIHAIIRRSKGHSQSVIHTGKIAVNLDAKTVSAEDQPVHLTGKEYQMLELLSLRKGTTLTKEMFLNHLYGGMDEPELKIIDVFICKLRKKLSVATGGENYIETVWGRGYVLRDPQGDQMSKPRLAVGA